MTAKRTINKAACKRLAGEVRAELGLEPMDALDPWQLAELYGVRVLALGHAASRSRHPGPLPQRPARSLLRRSAAASHRRGHRRERRPPAGAATLDHWATRWLTSLGEHKFGTSLVNERGCRTADKVQEDEAAEISGELLIPFEAAKRLARQKATDDEVALRFGVSRRAGSLAHERHGCAHHCSAGCQLPPGVGPLKGAQRARPASKVPLVDIYRLRLAYWVLCLPMSLIRCFDYPKNRSPPRLV